MLNIESSLVLVLLCFYFHACNARILGVLFHNNPAKEFQKNDVIPNPGNVISTKPDRKYSEKMENNYFPAKLAGDWVKGSGSRKTKSTGSVFSWRAPGKKTGEKEPGFNLDYLPPKTHPPVHN